MPVTFEQMRIQLPLRVRMKTILGMSDEEIKGVEEDLREELDKIETLIEDTNKTPSIWSMFGSASAKVPPKHPCVPKAPQPLKPWDQPCEVNMNTTTTNYYIVYAGGPGIIKDSELYYKILDTLTWFVSEIIKHDAHLLDKLDFGSTALRTRSHFLEAASGLLKKELRTDDVTITNVETFKDPIHYDEMKIGVTVKLNPQFILNYQDAESQELIDIAISALPRKSLITAAEYMEQISKKHDPFDIRGALRPPRNP